MITCWLLWLMCYFAKPPHSQLRDKAPRHGDGLWQYVKGNYWEQFSNGWLWIFQTLCCAYGQRCPLWSLPCLKESHCQLFFPLDKPETPCKTSWTSSVASLSHQIFLTRSELSFSDPRSSAVTLTHQSGFGVSNLDHLQLHRFVGPLPVSRALMHRQRSLLQSVTPGKNDNQVLERR